MLQALSIMVREGFEAALVIGIMLSYAHRTGRTALKRPILLSAAAAGALSVVAAFALSAAGVNAENPALEGVLYLTAAAFVVSTVVWMQRHAADLSGSVGRSLDSAVTRSATWGVALVAFFMVAREGVETVLLLAATSLDAGLAPTLIGGGIGLVIAIALGAAVYAGAARIDMRLFFAATTAALLLLASRFIGIGVLELGEAGVLALPEALEEGLELLEEGVLATAISTAVVALPLGAIGWSLLKNRKEAHPAA